MPKRKRKDTSIYISNELENAMHYYNMRVFIYSSVMGEIFENSTYFTLIISYTKFRYPFNNNH